MWPMENLREYQLELPLKNIWQCQLLPNKRFQHCLELREYLKPSEWYLEWNWISKIKEHMQLNVFNWFFPHSLLYIIRTFQMFKIMLNFSVNLHVLTADSVDEKAYIYTSGLCKRRNFWNYYLLWQVWLCMFCMEKTLRFAVTRHPKTSSIIPVCF